MDDSIFIRAILKQVLEDDPQKRFKVVASAKDGLDALTKLKSFEIDVITMDVEMPKKNGLETVKEIMEANPKPIIMLSSLTAKGAKETIEALSFGAVDFIQKPTKQIEFSRLKDEIYEKLEKASNLKPKTIKSMVNDFKPIKDSFKKAEVTIRDNNKSLSNILVIGCSTGGPRALQKIISELPRDLKVGIVIVQHMPEGGYTSSLANHLNESSHFEVKEAKDGDEIIDGKVLIAPGGLHVEVFKRGEKFQVVLNKKETVSGHRPSVDVLFSSAARVKGFMPLYGVVLTGMGSDGTNGAEQIKNNGGIIIAESENTSIIFGMPKQVIKKGLTDYVEDLENIIPRISKLLQKK